METKEDDPLDLILERAMLNARKAFIKTFEDEDLDSSYWALNMIGYELYTDNYKIKRKVEDSTYPYQWSSD